MIGGDVGAHEARWVLVVRKEASHGSHISLTERSWQTAFVHHHDVVFEVCQAKLVLESSLFHFNRSVLDYSTKFEPLSRKCTVHEEERGRDTLLGL